MSKFKLLDTKYIMLAEHFENLFHIVFPFGGMYLFKKLVEVINLFELHIVIRSHISLSATFNYLFIYFFNTSSSNVMLSDRNLC